MMENCLYFMQVSTPYNGPDLNQRKNMFAGIEPAFLCDALDDCLRPRGNEAEYFILDHHGKKVTLQGTKGETLNFLCQGVGFMGTRAKALDDLTKDYLRTNDFETILLKNLQY